MMFNSRGFKAAADVKAAQLEESLLKASQVLPPCNACDRSPLACLHQCACCAPIGRTSKRPAGPAG